VGAFGDKFRKEREKKNISLDDVSNVTKISSRMLKAIEQERFDQLPGGVFNKGFIRAYAKHLGMNDEEAVNDYLACLREAQADAHDVWEPARATQPRAAAPEKRTPYTKPALKTQSSPQVEELPGLQLPRAEHVRPPANKYLYERRHQIPWIAIGALVVLLAVFWWTRRPHAPHPAATSPVTQASPVTAASANETPAHPIPATTPAAHPGGSGSSAATSHPPATGAAKPAASATSSAAPAVGSPGAESAPANAAAVKPLTLVIRATENSWISVSADGQLISQETLIAPAHASFRASREISVKVGNAAGVTFLWNGKEIPAQGAEAEARTVTFDTNGLRSPQPVAAQPATTPQSKE
jgi:cytoskeleton protein RodZ